MADDSKSDAFFCFVCLLLLFFSLFFFRFCFSFYQSSLKCPRQVPFGQSQWQSLNRCSALEMRHARHSSEEHTHTHTPAPNKTATLPSAPKEEEMSGACPVLWVKTHTHIHTQPQSDSLKCCFTST